MSIFKKLSVLAVNQIAQGALKATGMVAGEHTIEHAVGFLRRHFTDHSQSLTNAMQRANDRAWQALEIALAGEKLWNRLDSADHKAIRHQIREFLDATPIVGSANNPGFRAKCLDELRSARKQGLFGDALDAESLAQEVGHFARFSDQQSMFDGEWRAVELLADECDQKGFATLAHLVRFRTSETDQSALLVTAVRFFFRREVESDAKLFQSLAWANLETLQANQERAFGGLCTIFETHRIQLEFLLDSIREVVEETHDAVLDIREEVNNVAKRLALLHRAVRPHDSLSITDEAERRMVKSIVAKYRALPDEERSQFPSLLNAIGKLEVATGAFGEAQQDFRHVARISDDKAVQAEAHYNLYCASLEQGEREAALNALMKAAKLNPPKYEPFPLRKFEPKRILGAGGFGVAFHCRNRLVDTDVVVKTLHGDTLARDMNEVFREGRTLDELDHPAIVRLRDCDYADAEMTRPYLVLDYFDGQTLEKHIAETGALSPDDLLDLMRPVAEALLAAHGRDILHRDVKPGNLLVRKDDAEDWHVKLIDFGLALKQKVIHGLPVDARTLAGMSITGTIDYAAPEQLGKAPGSSVGPYTDVYGFGKTCCFALFQTVQPLPKHWRQIPEPLADVLEKCLMESPDERWQDFAEVIAALNDITKVKSPAAMTALVCQSDEPATTDSTRATEWWRDAPGRPSSGIMEQAQRPLTGHTDAVLSVAFAYDGSLLVSGGADNTVRVWDVQNASQLKELHGHADKVWKVVVNPAKNIFEPNQNWPGHAASAGKDKAVHFWDLDSGKPVSSFTGRTNRSLAISPDGAFAATGNVSDGMIRLWEIRTGRELRRLKGHMSWVLSLDFTPDGDRLASGSADGAVRLWDVQSGREIRRMQGHSDQVCSVAVSPNGQNILSSGADRTVRLWALHSGRELRCFGDYRDQIWSVAFSPDGRYALTDSDAFSIRLWDLETGYEVAAPVGHTGKVLCVAFSPDGRLAASGSSDKTIVVWKLRGGGDPGRPLESGSGEPDVPVEYSETNPSEMLK